MEKVHAYVLIGFAALLGLFEGPGQIACVAVLITTALTGRFSNYRWSYVEWGILVWAVSGLVGLLGAQARPSSEDMFRPLMALSFLVGAVALKDLSKTTLKRMGVVFTVALIFNAAFGFVQFAIGEMAIDKWLLANPKSPQVHIPNHYGLRTVSGLYYNRLKLAHMCIPAIGLLVLAPLTLRDRFTKSKIGLYLALGLFLFVAIVMTQARMALAALCFAVVASAVVLARPKMIALLALGFVTAGGLTVWMRFGIERLQLLTTDLGIRAKIYGIGLRLFQDDPILGIGHGMYRTKATAIKQTDWASSYLVDAHQLYLHTLVETGVVGFLGLSLALIVTLVLLVRRIRKSRDEASSTTLMDRAVFFVLIAYLSLGFFHFPLHHAPVALTFWLVLGVSKFLSGQSSIEGQAGQSLSSSQGGSL